jgi:anti-anti-sigma factor
MAATAEGGEALTAPIVTMEVRQGPDGTAIVDIKGEVTSACESVLMSAYEDAGGADAKRLVLNFSGLDYMNSGGIGMLVTLLVRANRQHQQLAAFGLSDHYKQIFELTRLDEAISIYPDEGAALAGSAS